MNQYLKEFAVVAIIIGCVVALSVNRKTKKDQDEQPEVVTNFSVVSTQDHGIKFTPRYPDAPPLDPKLDPASPWFHEPFTYFTLKHAVTNDGLRHYGVLYIGPMRYLPPKPGPFGGGRYRIEIPTGYKCVMTNVGQRGSFNNSPVDFLVIPKTPEDYAAAEVETERIATINKQNDEHFRKTVREEMTKEGATSEEIETWLAGWDRHRQLRNNIGSDNYEKVLRSIDRAARAKEQ